MSAESRYVWWPAHREANLDLADPRAALPHVLLISVITIVLCLPPVTRATGIGAFAIVGLIGLHMVWYAIATFLLAPIPRPNLMMAGNLIVNIGISVAIPVVTRDPKSPLWMLPVLYACLNGAMQERKPCIAFLLAHSLTPILAIAPILMTHAFTPWSIAAPLLCAVFCAVGYNHLARVSARWREVRAEQTAALSVLRSESSARDRQRLMTDLSESVGSTLSIVALYGDLIDRHIDRPEELRSLAAMVRDEARAGLGDLRGMLGAITTEVADVEGLADLLRYAAKRGAEGSDLDIVVTTSSGGTMTVTGPIRLVVMHAFQSAVREACRHPGARRVTAQLAASTSVVTLELTDSAVHAPADDDAIARRVAELGGTFSRGGSSTTGTTVQMSVPRSSRTG